MMGSAYRRCESIFSTIIIRPSGESSIRHVYDGSIKISLSNACRERQITHRLASWRMRRRDHQAYINASEDIEQDLTHSTPSTGPGASEGCGSACSVVRPGSTEISGQFLTPQPSDPDDCSGLSRLVQPNVDLEYAEALEPMPEISVQYEKSALDGRVVTTAAEDNEGDVGNEGQDVLSGDSYQVSSYADCNELFHQYPANREVERLCDNFVDMSQNAETQDESATTIYQALTFEGSVNHPQHGHSSSLCGGIAVKMNNGPIASLASLASSMDRVSAILGMLFEKVSWHPNLMQMSVVEMHCSLRLALVLLCCGHNEDASLCLEFLLWCWSLQSISPTEATTTIDPFFQATNILTWILQTGQCDTNDSVCFALWESCQKARRKQNRSRNDKHTFTLQHILAVGRLALAAHSQGYELFFASLREFWERYGGTTLAQRLGESAYHSQRATIEYIDSKIKRPESIGETRLRLSTKNDAITKAIEQLLRWIRKQLLLYPALTDHGEIGFEDVWRHIGPLKDAEHLEQQILLSYLSYRGSPENRPGKVWFANKDCKHLPWSICLEWQSDEFPLLTLSALLSLAKYTEDIPLDNMISETWCTRMLVAVDRLLSDVKGTTAEFCTVVNDCCPDPDFTAPGMRNTWISPIKLDLPNNATVSGESLQELIRHLICSNALFGSTVPGTEREQMVVPNLDHYDPMLVDSPRSSRSGFGSMKSVCRRVNGGMKRSCASISTCSSLYLNRFNPSRSSLVGSLFGSLMNLSQHSLTASSWCSVRSSQQSEKPSVISTGDAMELDV